MSYKLNQQNPERRANILKRRDKVKGFTPSPRTAPRHSNNTRMLKALATLHKRVKDFDDPVEFNSIVESIKFDTATKKEIFGFHPTRKQKKKG